jgi:O-antigen/teichoic acid export membrane protein
MLKMVLSGAGETKKVENAFSTSFYYAKWSVGANVVATIGANMDIFMLNFLATDRESFGYYSIATVFIFAMRQVTDSIKEIATPYFSEKSGDRKEFLRVLYKYEKLMVLLSLALTIVSIIAVPIFIKVVYGADFSNTSIYFSILAIRYLLGSAYSLLGVSVLGLGKMKYNFLSSTINVPITIVLSYVFITYYGIVGAAIAQALAAFISLFFWVPITKKAIKNHFDELESAEKNAATVS